MFIVITELWMSDMLQRGIGRQRFRALTGGPRARHRALASSFLL